MKKLAHETMAYFFDDECGTVVRALFAGLGSKDTPLWVNITPGMLSQTLAQMRRAEGYGRWHLLAVDGEQVSECCLVRMLLAVMNSPSTGDLATDLPAPILQLEQFGVRLSHESVFRLHVYIYRSQLFGSTSERNHFTVYDSSNQRMLGGVDEFDELSDIIHWLSLLFAVLRSAGVNLETVLHISPEMEKLLQEECCNYTREFDHISVTTNK